MSRLALKPAPVRLVIELAVGAETYVLIFRPQDFDAAMLAIHDWAENPAIDFCWQAASEAMEKIRAVAIAWGYIDPSVPTELPKKFPSEPE